MFFTEESAMGVLELSLSPAIAWVPACLTCVPSVLHSQCLGYIYSTADTDRGSMASFPTYVFSHSIFRISERHRHSHSSSAQHRPSSAHARIRGHPQAVPSVCSSWLIHLSSIPPLAKYSLNCFSPCYFTMSR